MFPRHIRGEEV